MARDRSFKATGRMYKTRFKKWGLRKKNGAAEMKAIARILRISQQSGDTAIFESHRRLITAAELQRYLKRKHLTLDEFIEGRPDLSEHANVSLQAPRYIGSSADFDIFERLLYNVDVYIRGSFEVSRRCIISEKNGIVEASRDTLNASNANLRSEALDLENLVFSALGVSGNNGIANMSRAWACVSREISSIVSRQNIHTFTRLCYFTQGLMLNGKVGIAHAILRQLSNLTAVKQGTANPGNPLLHLYKGLLLANPSEIDQLINILQLRVAHILENILGSMHVESLNQRALLALHTTSRRVSPLQARELLEKYRKLDLPMDRRFLLVFMQYVQTLLNHREYTLLIEAMSSYSRSVEDQQRSLQFREAFYMHSCLAIGHDMLNDTELAESAYQQAVDSAHRFYESDARGAATYLRWFETNWRAHQNHLRTPEIRKLRQKAENKVLGHFDGTMKE
ncbi:MAG: hypothetical protein Q9157_006048 [Trypethelium eluteriae]